MKSPGIQTMVCREATILDYFYSGPGRDQLHPLGRTRSLTPVWILAL